MNNFSMKKNFLKNFNTVFMPINENKLCKKESKAPNYSLEKIGDGVYMLSIPVPGMSEKDIALIATDAAVTVEVKQTQENKEYIHKGFDPKGWTYTFALKDNLIPHLSYLKSGVLYIELFNSDLPLKSEWKAMPYSTDRRIAPISIAAAANQI